MSEKSCWIILPKKVNSRYRSETLLKQISLQVFLNYCSNILVVGFVYFLSDFSRSRSSDLKAFCKKNVFLKKSEFNGKHLCQSFLLKLQNALKKRLWCMCFSVNFTKVLRNFLYKLSFVEHLQRFGSEIAKFQAVSSPFLKEAVIFNCLSIKNNKTWYFVIYLPLISFKIMLTKYIFDYHPILEKKTEGVEDMEFQRVLKKESRDSRVN